MNTADTPTRRAWTRACAIAAIATLCCTAGAAAPAASKPPLFVLNSLDATISVVDAESFRETARIPTGKEPHHLYLAPDEKSLWVANALADSLTVIDPHDGRVLRVITGIEDPYQLRFSPDMKWFVTAGNRLDLLSIYRWHPESAGAPLELAGRVHAPRTPSHLAIDRASRTVYATLQDSDELVAIDLATQTPRWKVPTGHAPADLFLFADDTRLLVALTGDRFVEVYDLTRPRPVLLQRIVTGNGAHAFRAQGDGRHVFVSNRAADTISRIDLQKLAVVDTDPAPGGPDCMDVTHAGHTLLVTSRWARKLTEIDLDRHVVTRQLDVGRSPHGVWTLDHVRAR
jgi:YVTN family beta-propeller protein